MPYGYDKVYNGELVNVPEEFAEKAQKETRGNITRREYFQQLKEKEKAKNVSAQSRLFARHGTRNNGENEVDDKKQQERLTELRKQPFANKATAKMQQEAILEMSRLRDAKAKQENWAEQSRRQRER